MSPTFMRGTIHGDLSGGFGPMCRCGSRNTARIGESALTRQCQACGETYRFKLRDGILVPHSLETALAMDEVRL